MLFSIISTSSCTRQQEFGDLIICSEVDPVTFSPLDTKNSFDIGIQKIFAAIEVSGVRASDIWKFIWINEDSEEVIAQSTDRYSSEGSGYIEGYLSNYVTPGTETDIIGEPGNYRVEFYHNGNLMTSADFIIEYPEMELIDVVLSNEVDETGQPVLEMEVFNPDEIIYTCLKFNSQIKGETVGVRWYRGDDELLGEEEITIEMDYYFPDYIIFEITNDELWPVDGYRVEVFHNGLLENEYQYEVTEGEFADATFDKNNAYQNEEYKFSILYPDEWNYEEAVSARGFEINFKPDSDDINARINMQVLKEGYTPSEDGYPDFADRVLRDVLKEIANSSETAEFQKTESTGETNGVAYRQINYSHPGENNNGPDISIVFISQENTLYLLIKVSDIYYRTFADNVLESMLKSLSFD